MMLLRRVTYIYKVDNALLLLSGHLYLSGMWFGVAPRTDTKEIIIFVYLRLSLVSN